MNRLSVERRAEAINCLVEGNSIRSTERLTGIHRDTVMRLMVEVGEGCARIMDEKMREVQSKRIQVDEIWSYVRKKQVHLNWTAHARTFAARMMVADCSYCAAFHLGLARVPSLARRRATA